MNFSAEWETNDEIITYLVPVTSHDRESLPQRSVSNGPPVLRILYS